MEQNHKTPQTPPPSSIENEVEELLRTLEKATNWNGLGLVKYNGFWFLEQRMRPIVSVQKHFKAKDSDIMVASLPKCGTTWLKALTFTIVHRNGMFPIDRSPLLTSNPHELVPALETELYGQKENPDLGHIPCPRILHTHIPFSSLPKSILNSKCRIVYICRNPLDQFISFRTFLLENKIGSSMADLEESIDQFSNGIISYGPFWDHMLGYWNAHLKHPEKVLFLKYEDLKDNITFQIKKIAEFLGVPISLEEEKSGVIERISNLCSFKTLSTLEVNKSGNICFSIGVSIKKSSFFRKGEIGDWANYLTPTMAEKIKKVMNTKLNGSGLSFNI